MLNLIARHYVCNTIPTDEEIKALKEISKYMSILLEYKHPQKGWLKAIIKNEDLELL